MTHPEATAGLWSYAGVVLTCAGTVATIFWFIVRRWITRVDFKFDTMDKKIDILDNKLHDNTSAVSALQGFIEGWLKNK